MQGAIWPRSVMETEMEVGWACCRAGDMNFTEKSMVSWDEVYCVESQHGFEADAKQWHCFGRV